MRLAGQLDNSALAVKLGKQLKDCSAASGMRCIRQLLFVRHYSLLFVPFTDPVLDPVLVFCVVVVSLPNSVVNCSL